MSLNVIEIDSHCLNHALFKIFDSIHHFSRVLRILANFNWLLNEQLHHFSHFPFSGPLHCAYRFFEVLVGIFLLFKLLQLSLVNTVRIPELFLIFLYFLIHFVNCRTSYFQFMKVFPHFCVFILDGIVLNFDFFGQFLNFVILLRD